MVLALALAPAAWVAGEAADAAGAGAWKAALKEIGLWTIRLLLVTLAVTPVGRSWRRRGPGLRRMLGLATLGYALLHLVLYAADTEFQPAGIASEIVLRVYLTIGFVALLGLAVLGWTSTDGWMRELGKRWKRLHGLVFRAGGARRLHFFLQSKS